MIGPKKYGLQLVVFGSGKFFMRNITIFVLIFFAEDLFNPNPTLQFFFARVACLFQVYADFLFGQV